MEMPGKPVVLGINERTPPDKVERKILDKLAGQRDEEIRKEIELTTQGLMSDEENQRMDARMREIAERRGELEAYETSAEIDRERRKRLIESLRQEC
jgi:hypothetical protein